MEQMVALVPLELLELTVSTAPLVRSASIFFNVIDVEKKEEK